jgi:hypothetical protein
VYPATKLITMPAESQELKNAGLKITLPRIKILEILESSKVHHLSAEDVYKHLLQNDEEIGLATVYRVLTQFEDAGLVIRHHFEYLSFLLKIITIIWSVLSVVGLKSSMMKKSSAGRETLPLSVVLS